MKGYIDREDDFTVFLENDDLKILKNKSIAGILVDREKPKFQFNFTLSIDDYWGYTSSFGGSVVDLDFREKNEECDIKISTLTHQELLKYSQTGFGYYGGVGGSKLSILDMSSGKKFIENNLYHGLVFKIENRDRLIE